MATAAVALGEEGAEPREHHEHEDCRHDDGSLEELGVLGGLDARPRRSDVASAGASPRTVAVENRVLYSGGQTQQKTLNGVSYLKAVNELSQRDVLAVVEDVNGTELLFSAVPKLEAQELAGVRWRRTAELDGNGGAVVGDGRKLLVIIDGLCLVEEGDERLVGGRDKHKLKRVAVEGDALQGAGHRVEKGARRD